MQMADYEVNHDFKNILKMGRIHMSILEFDLFAGFNSNRIVKQSDLKHREKLQDVVDVHLCV